jgi:iron complex outermembrane receptor protein
MRIVSLVAAFLLGLVAVSAHARDNATHTTYTLNPVVVTAGKQTQDIQDVEGSIDAFTATDIQQAGFETFADMIQYMPNVLGKVNFGITRAVIRGVETPNGVLFSPSGFFIDDIPYLIPELRNIELLDIESVEVLKGPQGTLYGGNSETGVINVVSSRPGNEFGGHVSGGYASYNTAKFQAGVNVPVIEDKLLMNLAVSSRTSDGYVDNIYDDSDGGQLDHKNVRGAVRWLPTENLTVDLIYNAFVFNDRDGSVRIESGPGSTDRHEINRDGVNRNDREGDSQALRVEHTGEHVNILSITTRNRFASDYESDADMTPMPLWEHRMEKDHDAYSQEFRFSSPQDNSPWKWLAGVYGMAQWTEYNKEADMSGRLPMLEQRNTKVDSQNLAAYGQITYTFFDKLHLTGGLRADYTQQQGRQDYSMQVGRRTLSKEFEEDLYDTEILPKVSVGFDVTDNAMVYASASKGFLAGGFNAVRGETQDQFTYDPEYMWSYEVGVKTTWWKKRLQLDVAAFWLDIEDKQVMEVVGYDRSVANADSAESRGVEVTLRARPLEGLDFFGGLGVLDTRFIDWETPVYDYGDKDMPFAPKYTYNVGAQYLHSTGIFSRVDMTGRSSFYTDAENRYECDGYQLFNARLGYASDSWDVTLWCKNIFDEEYITDKRKWTGDGVAVADGEPRSIGVDVTWRF